jgi:erythronate-4-phosphate dehydrogenase
VPEELINRAFLATPHIAGYSFDGKVNGTTQIYHAACQHFGIAPSWTPNALLPQPEVPTIDGAESLLEIIRKLYTIHTDDTHLREALALPPEERGKHFDNLRKNYRQRREFQHTTIHNAPEELVATLKGLGFQVR